MTEKIDISVYDDYAYYSVIADQCVKNIVSGLSAETNIKTVEIGVSQDGLLYDKSCANCRRCDTVWDALDAFLMTEIILTHGKSTGATP